MPGSGLFLDYTGIVDHEKITHLLKSLKKSEEFLSLDKTTGKKFYAILVECLENIARYSIKKSGIDVRFQPFIIAGKQDNKIVVKTGNPVHNGQKEELVSKLNIVNQTVDVALTGLYDEIISKETKPGDNGAGLGFIIMKLKSGNKIDYNFTLIDNKFSFFEINILINRFTMRKLILKKTDSSPKVNFDPDKNVFEISGESRPPDVSKFYGEILRWWDEYALHLLNSKESKDNLVVNFDLEYFNSSSAKYILDFCKQLASLRSKGRLIDVKWKYEEDDDDMLEAGMEMSRISKLPFEYVNKDLK
ncbi:MAG: SiaC family regulatory phosphoprotein [Bacteroidota bacterium]